MFHYIATRILNIIYSYDQPDFASVFIRNFHLLSRPLWNDCQNEPFVSLGPVEYYLDEFFRPNLYNKAFMTTKDRENLSLTPADSNYLLKIAVLAKHFVNEICLILIYI